MAIIASGMVQDAVASLQSGDLSLAEEVSQRDDEVDRFYHFIVRQLNMAVRNRAIIEEVGLLAARDCLGYRLAVKSIERVADHAAGIARLVPSLRADALGKISQGDDEDERALAEGLGSGRERPRRARHEEGERVDQPHQEGHRDGREA